MNALLAVALVLLQDAQDPEEADAQGLDESTYSSLVPS